MSTYTITTAVNIDTLAAKAGSDTYNINGGYLTVDQHTRYGTNQNTSAGMGNITLSATLGGTIEFNSTLVRMIAYNTGTGNVPALGTTISKGGASGILLGVYSALNVAPTAAAAAMPVTGFILIRQWNSVSYSAGALTGIGASATEADRAGWLEIVGVDALTVTVNRLNTFKVRGAYYDFQGVTTSGSSATTYQIPSNGSLVYLPGVEVETGTGTDVYEFYPCAGTQLAHVDCIATDAIRGKVCWISTAGLVTFQNDGLTTSGGYLPPSGRKLRIPNIFFMTCTAAGLTANVLPNATLATRMEFLTTGGGVLDIDKACINWYCNWAQPYSVALTNTMIMTQILLQECAAALTWSNVNVGQEAQNAQTGLLMSLCFAGGTFTSCTFTRAGAMGSGNYVGILSEMLGFTFTSCKWLSLGVRSNAASGALSLTRVNQSTFTSNTLGGGRALITTCSDLNFTNTVYYDHAAWTTNYTAGNTLAAIGWTRVTTTATITSTAHGLKVGDTFNVSVSSDTLAITTGAKTVLAVTNANVFTVTCLNGGAASGTISYNRTATQFAMYAYDIASSCARLKFDGLTFGGQALVQPYSGILNIAAANCNDIKLRNLGTAASPLSMGGAFVSDATWTRATTVLTITQASHGLKIGDIIALQIMSDTAVTAVTTTTATLKTVVTVPSSSTFTITVTNAGAASGTCSYYPTMASQLLVLASGAAAKNVKVQRCYTPALRTGIVSSDNSSKGITLESVWGTEWGVYLIPQLNGVNRGLQSTPALTAQTATYGTHFVDYYTTGAPANIAAVAWSRSTTTATITSAAHGLRTGNVIVVNVTSDAAAIILGQKTITATTAGAFTFTCLNAGAASGTLTFTVLNSRIAIQMNEATSDTTSQVVLANGAAFTSAGGLYMPTVGHSATFIADKNIVGHSSFPIAEAVMAGGTIGNYDISYSLDAGVTYYNLAYTRAGGGGSNGSTNVTMTSTTGVAVGDYVWGTNIAPNTKVTSITNGTTVVVDIANIGAVSGVLRFNRLPSETVSNAVTTGFPLRIRIVTSTTNATAITSLFFYTNSTTAARAALYPLDLVTLTSTIKSATDSSAIQDARVYIVAAAGGPEVEGTVLLNTLTNASGVASTTYAYTGDQPVTGRVRKGTSGTLFKTSLLAGTITSSGLSLTAFMVADQ